MCLPFTSIFNCCVYNKLSQEELRKKRINMLPFSWKYKITPHSLPHSVLETNVQKTQHLAEKSENLASSAKEFRDLTRELNNR
jgi:hypothetical protein